MPPPIEYLILHNKKWYIVHLGTASHPDGGARTAFWCERDGGCVVPIGQETRLFDLDELEASDV